MNDSGDEASLASLIERSAELKRALVDFACSPRFERHLARFMEAAGPGGELNEGEAIAIIDRFALQHRLPEGKTVLDQFLASWPGLTAADREMLRGWRDPVEGIFEIRAKDRDAIVLLNLIDDRRVCARASGADLALRGQQAGRRGSRPPAAQGLAGLRDAGGLPQVQRRTDCAGRAGTGDQTAWTGLPQPGENRAGLEADAGG